MIAIFLGAGFSMTGGVPLASQLFDGVPIVDVVSRQQLVDRVLGGWKRWSSEKGGRPEQYLAVLEQGKGEAWEDAVWYVGLVVALKMGQIRVVGGKAQLVRQGIGLTTGISDHEAFWTSIFRQTSDVVVLTTNYDILAERGLRLSARPRVPRPGFNYGFGPEQLVGRGYPSFSHIRPIRAAGAVPLLKLHGSVSWSLEQGSIVHYSDCRPAIRGNAAIVAPITEKRVPEAFRPIWGRAETSLRASGTWFVVGYSFPPYDMAINDLVVSSAQHRPVVHVFNPDPSVVDRVQTLLPASDVVSHGGLPDALIDLPKILNG